MIVATSCVSSSCSPQACTASWSVLEANWARLTVSACGKPILTTLGCSREAADVSRNIYYISIRALSRKAISSWDDDQLFRCSYRDLLVSTASINSASRRVGSVAFQPPPLLSCMSALYPSPAYCGAFLQALYLHSMTAGSDVNAAFDTLHKLLWRGIRWGPYEKREIPIIL